MECVIVSSGLIWVFSCQTADGGPVHAAVQLRQTKSEWFNMQSCVICYKRIIFNNCRAPQLSSSV